MHYIIIAIICVIMFALISRYMNSSQGEALKTPIKLTISALLSLFAFILFLKGNLIIAALLALGALMSYYGQLWPVTKADQHVDKKYYNKNMSQEEALEILGLQQQPSEQDIKEAHKKLMLKIHPDHGGSSYLAQQINAAKDLLLKNS